MMDIRSMVKIVTLEIIIKKKVSKVIIEGPNKSTIKTIILSFEHI